MATEIAMAVAWSGALSAQKNETANFATYLSSPYCQMFDRENVNCRADSKVLGSKIDAACLITNNFELWRFGTGL